MTPFATPSGSSPHELAAGLDDRHAAAEASERLGRLDADVAAAEHDQMRRQVIELERLDVRERAGRLEARNVRNGGMRAEPNRRWPSLSPSGAARRSCHIYGSASEH